MIPHRHRPAIMTHSHRWVLSPVLAVAEEEVALVLVALFIILFDENTAYTLLAIIGLVITLLHPIWLRHIYKRMMLRKYDNLEGFHASR